jgi:hypothetical protein
MNEEVLSPAAEATSGGMSRNLLKGIAIMAMVIDHTAHAFVPESSVLYLIMRFVGRITGPVMFFAAAEGYHHTKNINKYMMRLAIFAIVSYFPFIYFDAGGVLNGLNYSYINVIFTIFLGVAAIRIRRELQNPILKTLLILVLFVLSFPADWGPTGLLMMLTFDYFYGSFRYQAFAYCLIAILNAGLIQAAENCVRTIVYNPGARFNISGYWYVIINSGMLLPIIMLRFYNKKRGGGGRLSKWFFYVFYPAHLLVLGLLQFLFL